MLSCKEEVLKLTKQLVQIPSIVNTQGESKLAQAIYEQIQSLPYFVENPTYVTKVQTLHDDHERYNVLAIVKGTKQKSERTVLLMGHLDTVGIEDFNHLKDLACDPDQLLRALHTEKLPDIVNQQLTSGEWLFGRGVLDMKSGVASNLYLLKYFSERPHELEGNLMFLCECDEEDSSNGILSALKTLNKWKQEEQLEYVAAINTDFVSPRYEGDQNRYIYKGTVGKLLPAFFVTGAETHVGSCFEGLDPNFIVAELTKEIDYNPELSNEAFGEVTVPPVSLKQSDLKPSYTVQTALSAFVYYNFFVHSWSPKDVLVKLKEHAKIAFDRSLNIFQLRYKKYCELSGEPFIEISWKNRVFTYQEMNDLLIKEHGNSYVKHMENFKRQLLLNKELDIRMFSARVIEEAWNWMTDKSPAIILSYPHLYSPRIELIGKNQKEKDLLLALDQAIEACQPHYKFPIVTKNFFPYISDMSFVALSDNEDDLQAVIQNNPAWGSKHYVEFQDIRDINIPVINIGPYGFDAHKRFERMEINYSTELVPNLIHRIIYQLLG